MGVWLLGLPGVLFRYDNWNLLSRSWRWNEMHLTGSVDISFPYPTHNWNARVVFNRFLVNTWLIGCLIVLFYHSISSSPIHSMISIPGCSFTFETFDMPMFESSILLIVLLCLALMYKHCHCFFPLHCCVCENQDSSQSQSIY